MPQTPPSIKVDAVDAARASALGAQLITETGLTFIHPFDDPLVIAGQGTIADEILRMDRIGFRRSWMIARQSPRAVASSRVMRGHNGPCEGY